MMRPKKKIEFAPQDRMTALEPLAPRFFEEVVGYDFRECLVTDESDLWDFVSYGVADREAEVAEMLDRMDRHYFVESRKVGSTRIVDLLEHLARSGVTG
jgi:hypothetical protein